MTSPAPTEKEKSLISLYQKMETDEIERRLVAGGLTDLAKVVARVELKNREGQARVTAADGTSHSAFGVVLVLLGATALTGLLGYILLSKEMFYLVMGVVVLPTIAAVIGKLVPGLGILVGGVLMATPVWLGGWMWHAGALQWKTGDFAPLGSLLAYVFLFIASIAGMGLGGAMMGGALHEGSWDEFGDELEARRKESLDAISKVRRP